MATQLDQQEQEQLDALKAFWGRQGNLITWTLVLVMGAFAAWNGWQYWQRNQAAQAAAMFEALDRAAAEGDLPLVARVFGDLSQRYPRTAFAEQGGLTAAKAQLAKGQTEAGQASLRWVAEHAVEDEMRTVARLRLAETQAEQHAYAAALQTLDGATAPSFAALSADRRGDILLAMGRKDEARSAYRKALASLSDKVDYRRLVEGKLMALGVAPAPAASGAAS
jgi:predicted negative regulator of RcsB-dependent stress response